MLNTHNSIINYFTYKSPAGNIQLATIPKINGKEDVIFCVEFQDNRQVFLERLQRQLGNHISLQPKDITTVLRAMEGYFQGKQDAFNNTPSVFMCGTRFQQDVWNTLKTIPYGETRSYQWVAEQINNPKAYRAVGTANGINPLPIIFPCHRVIHSAGSLGGYRGGLNIKRCLLKLENKKASY